MERIVTDSRRNSFGTGNCADIDQSCGEPAFVAAQQPPPPAIFNLPATVPSAMYAKQAGAAGWLGLTGHALLQTGILLLVVTASTPLLYPSLKTTPGENPVIFFLGIALTLGLLLTGIATIRASVYPQWAGIVLLAAMAGFFFVFFVAEFLPPQAGQIGSAFFGILLALALAWIGFSMWAG